MKENVPLTNISSEALTAYNKGTEYADDGAAMYDAVSIGSRMRKRREEMRLTQSDAAELIGRSLRFYADIERGSTGMSVETLLAISKTFDMSPDELLLEKMPSVTDTRINRVIKLLQECSKTKQERAVEMLELFLKPME